MNKCSITIDLVRTTTQENMQDATRYLGLRKNAGR